ncbi:MAG: chromosome segregation protein SMC [Thermaerobacterales bacterium]
MITFSGQNSSIYLKRIEVQGFKSFADRTVLEFGPGVSAVVGANGSGKSNLAEAIRWVLGEQSARQLRGSRMEDIIFAGSVSRRPVGLAQVTLTLDNAEGALAVPFTEVTLTRRVDRGGASEFLLNGASCRLRDIQEILFDTGLGREAYSVVGQGRIDQVLSAKGHERRTLVEEAAGIVRFKSRKTEALRRLNQVRLRMIRLADILANLEERLEPLQIEAGKARQHRHLSSELNELETRVQLAAVHRLRQKLARRQKAAAAVEEQLAELQTSVKAKEQAVVDYRRRLDTADANLEDCRSGLDALAAELEEARAQARLAEADIGHLTQEAERLKQEMKDLETRLVDQGSRDDQDAAEIGRLEAQVSTLNERFSAAAAAAERAEQEETEARRSSQRQRDDLMRVMEERNRIDGETERLEAELAELAGRELETVAAVEGGRADLERLIQEVRAAEEKHRRALRRREEADSNRESLLGRRRVLQKSLAEAEVAGLKSQENLGEIRSRLRLVSEMQRHYEGYNQGVRTVMQGKAAGENAYRGVIGTVADLITAPQEYEAAVEAVLGGALQNVVTVTGEDAQRAVEELKARRGGRATFLPLDSLAAREPSQRDQALAGLTGIRGWAIDLVKFSPDHRLAVAQLLGRTLVADGLTSARVAARAGGFRYRVVTVYGDVVHAGGAVSGGSRVQQSRANLLSRGRHEDELKLRREAAETRLSESRSSTASLQANLQQCEEQLEAAAEKAHAAAWDVTQAHDRLTQTTERRRRQERQNETLDRQQQQAAIRRTRLEERLTVNTADRKRIGEELRRHREGADAVDDRLPALEQIRKDAERERAQAGLELERARQALAALQELRSRSVLAREDLERTLQRRAERLHDLEQRLKVAGRHHGEAQAGAAALNQRQAEIRDRLQELQETRLGLATRLRTEEEELVPARAGLDGLRENLHQRQLEAAEARSEYGQAAGALRDAYGVDPDNDSMIEGESLEPGAVRRAQSRAREIQQELAGLGEVNPLAERELVELSGRQQYLRGQFDDLFGASKGLTEAIESLDERMNQLFMTAFSQLRERFDAIFKRLFNGGRADLVLSGPPADDGEESADPDDRRAAEQAIDVNILAQPPDKRLQPLPLLSGGERALTAIALLFALLEVRPTPFCVVDEIDASLDEVNQHRFADYLSELSSRMQFIVITHQKTTMAAADLLYGVTMSEGGISRLMAVRMAELTGS